MRYILYRQKFYKQLFFLSFHKRKQLNLNLGKYINTVEPRLSGLTETKGKPEN